MATSSKNLEKLVEQGLFRLDLYLRLNLVLIKNIPLRERKEDLPKLVEFFIEKYAPTAHIAMQSIPDEYMQSLMEYDFPGNVRELEHMIGRTIVTSKDGEWQYIMPTTLRVAK